VRSARSGDRTRSGIARSRSHTGVSSTGVVAIETGAVRERAVIETTAGRVSRIAKAVLGTASMARGYFCATVGAVDEKTVKEYIENQKWDDDAEGFKITAPTKP
jgi:REP element-mobilizing transposase RayT